ncbi:MAG: hydroxylamine reductase, partial [Bacteroidales bacterium]|nr:hydroxylamine reductase [Bacteroidales bacterium]
MNAMFCSQCQETAQNTGCVVRGVCGKSPEVANYQDLLIYVMKGLAKVNQCLRSCGKGSDQVDLFIMNGLFMTITNANFDKKRFSQEIKAGLALRDALKKEAVNCKTSCDFLSHDAMTWTASTEEEMEAKAKSVGILSTPDEDIRALRQLLVLGIKGMAAYTEHAYNLKHVDKDIFDFMQMALASTLSPNQSKDELLGLVMKCGEYGVKTMALLDKANTSTYGNPEITKVNIGVKNRPAILISGHDLKDLDELLAQAEPEGVDVYTHSEMLPAHYYPYFKKYKNLAGNYGNAWHRQTKEFETFNGPILFTTNCIVPPRPDSTYSDRIYTTGSTGFDGFPHIADRLNDKPKDFSQIIAHAKRCKAPEAIENGEIIGGFAHNQVIALADKVVEAVKSGAIRKFVVMAGCDGRMKSREYYTEFAQNLPKDTIILTAGCAKYRYNKLQLGDIGGIPRVLDAGQCNDSY